MDIIDEIILARKQKGITQQKLSEMTGILQPVIARVEAKKSSPTIDFLYKILRALDLDLTLVKRNELKNNIIEFFNERAENWDKNPKSAEFLKKKINSLIEQKENVYGECDIMYSYEIEGEVHEEDSYSG